MSCMAAFIVSMPFVVSGSDMAGIGVWVFLLRWLGVMVADEEALGRWSWHRSRDKGRRTS